MRSKKNILFILTFCFLGIIGSFAGIIFGIISMNDNIDNSDIIKINCRLTDDPYLKTVGGKNPITYLVLSFDKFQGYKLKTPKNYFDEDNLTFILKKVKSKTSVEIGLLKNDFHLLTSNNKPWGIIEGFKTSKKLSYMPIYHLNTNEKTLLQLKEVNKRIRKDGFTTILGSGFFLLIFALGFNEVRKIKNEYA